MRKMLVLTTLLFGLLLAGCSEDGNNNGSQAGNSGGDGNANFEGNNPALSIKTSYAGGLRIDFQATLFNAVLDETYSYLWEFGEDNAQSTLSNPSYTYKTPGTKTVNLKVRDSKGVMIGSTVAIITIDTTGEILEARFGITEDPNDKLVRIFDTPVYSSDDVPVEITWDFSDGSPIIGTNKQSHRFSKYGKTYDVQMTARHPVNGDTLKSGVIKVTTDTPGLNIACTSSALTVTCTPQVTGIDDGLQDAVYTWQFSNDGGGSSVTKKTFNNEPVTYTFTSVGTKNISVDGTASNLEGTISTTGSVTIDDQISLGNIQCESTGTLLQYTCSVSASLADNNTGTLSFNWTFNGQQPTSTSDGGKTATYTFATFPPKNNPVYPVSVTASTDNSDETATTSSNINIPHPTVTINRGASDNSTSVSFYSTLSHAITGANYMWTISGPNFNQTIQGKNKTDTGQITLPADGTYTANLTVSHDTFASNISAEPLSVAISSTIRDANFSCTVTGMQITCTSPATAYATVGGQQQQVPVNYSWNIARGDGKETYNITGRNKATITQQVRKYDGTYNISLLLTAEGTSSSVLVNAKTYKTGKPTLSIKKSAASIGVNKSIRFEAIIGGLQNNVGITSPVYTWKLDNVVQQTSGSIFEPTFTTPGEHTIQVSVTSDDSLGSPLTASTTITALNIDIRPDHVQSVAVNCNQRFDSNDQWVNDIRRACTATISFNGSADKDGIDKSRVTVRLTPRGVRGNSDSPAVKANSGQQVEVIFDWPFLDITKISNRDARQTFVAKLGIAVYVDDNTLLKTFNDQSITINYPKVSYEFQHTANAAANKIGTGPKLRKHSNITEFKDHGGGTTWQYHIYMKGSAAGAGQNFNADSDGTEVSFGNLMKQTKFSGPLTGNPFNLQSGVGVKISGGRLSKPLYLYGLNTAWGKTNIQNSFASYYYGTGWMTAEGTMGYNNYLSYRDTGNYAYKVFFYVSVPTDYIISGWNQFCVVGAIGKSNGSAWLYSLPAAAVLTEYPSVKGQYYTVLGQYYSLTEKRQFGVAQGGQPMIPSDTGKIGSNNGNKYWAHNYNTTITLGQWGFRGVHVGYSPANGNLEQCRDVKAFLADESQTKTDIWNPVF